MDLLLASISSADTVAVSGVLRLANDVDPSTCSLQGVTRVELHFPKFSDGRAYSQAVLLRRRLGFQGDIRAVGDVLIDQVQHMSRTGFTSAELRADQSIDKARQQLQRFADFYQGDALNARPRFARV
ncbi:MAG: hypothetical protein RJA69_72 [Pseudomonadota bacterium]|jgi:uncharacterized protein (DUF934 family)